MARCHRRRAAADRRRRRPGATDAQRPVALLAPLVLGLLLAPAAAAGRPGALRRSEPTPDDAFLCKDHADRDLLLRPGRHCDGVFDCRGGVDEMNCTACRPGAWKCATGSQCIPEMNKCNGLTDCDDGSDEERDSCLGDDCIGQSRFKCSDGVCIHQLERCDGVAVCEDNSDEEGCCADDEFQCPLAAAGPVCISQLARCDGRQDCPDGEDERICIDCLSGAFRCHLSSSWPCISVERRCDGVSDCDGGEDEADCPHPVTSSGQSRRPRRPELSRPVGGGARAWTPLSLLAAGLTVAVQHAA